MKNNVYSLVAPKTIELITSEIKDESAVIVRPTNLSICHADQRYYQGTRPKEILDKKLPMALIHEGIGTVMNDPEGQFKKGEWVVMIPNTPFESDEFIAENYLRSSKFRASGFDGFMQSAVAMRRDRIVALPKGIDHDVAAFTEICSVSYHAINRFDTIAHGRRDTVGIWGEGNLGYITSLLLKKRFPNTKVLIFGVVEEKMKEFTFADACYSIDSIPEDVTVDHAFECVGSVHSGAAINQIINDVIKPEGTISLMGVSEEPVPINTRMVLEKGLRLFGSSRSGYDDFRDLLDLYAKDQELTESMKIVIGDVVDVHNIDDIHKAFETDIKNGSRKTVMHWNID